MCEFAINGCCYALVCYSSEACKGRDEHGHPRYVTMDERRRYKLLEGK